MMTEAIILGLIAKYPQNSHWIIFLSLIIAGFNIPISEDLILFTSGVLASQAQDTDTRWFLWMAAFFGAYISDWIAYWTGRWFGPKIFTIKWLSKIVKKERIEKMHSFYEKWGFLAFLVGRFVPFGVRNCLFISAGMGNMSFTKFLFIDGFASLISTTSAFLLAYVLGDTISEAVGIAWLYIKNNQLLIPLGIILFMTVIAAIWYKKRKKASIPQ
jgi:membrane-associated protein